MAGGGHMMRALRAPPCRPLCSEEVDTAAQSSSGLQLVPLSLDKRSFCHGTKSEALLPPRLLILGRVSYARLFPLHLSAVVFYGPVITIMELPFCLL